MGEMTTGTTEGPGALDLRIITPHAGLEGFRTAVTSLWREFGHARSLAWRFFLRDTRAEHRQSLLGYFWLIVPVLANTLTWVFLNDQQVIRINTGSVPYPLFVLSGVILWTAFNGGVMAMLGVVNLARGFIAKVNFPHEALVYSAILKAALDAALASILVIPVVAFFGTQWSLEMLLYPVALAGSLAVGAALGLLLVPVATLYGDVSRGIQLLLRFGFFLTPVVYALPPAGMARSLMMVNPATPVIASGRAWLTGSNESMPAAFSLVVAAAVLIFFAGIVVYKVAMPHIIERVGG